MAEITQTLGFDVSQALEALAQFDKALVNTGKSLTRLAENVRAFNGVGSGAAKVNKNIEVSMNAGAKATERLTVSWGLLARVVTTQLIVSEFGRLRRTLADAASSATDFERQIALIQTIDDTGTSFERTADAVRKLSDAYNLSLADAGAGVYQAISNQVGNFAQSLEFTTEAAKFARATNASLKDSVDLLSGALKSYNLNVEDTSKVSGIFFSVIDKGRIEASQLANTFGRVGPLAAQLGVPLEDLGGSLAAISVKGSKSAETLTMYRAILSGLLKPTPELAAELHKMGFASTEAAIATLHVDGVLRELVKSTGGSSQALARLFQNIRALSGVESLASDFQTLANDIESARAAGAEFAETKWGIATKTNAEEVTAAINRIRNALSVDLGRSVLQATADLSQFVGGAETIIDVSKAAGPALLGLGAGFLVFRGHVAAARAELVGLSRALGALALLPVAYGVGGSIGKYIGSKMVEDAERNLRQLEKANEEALAVFKRQQSEKRDAANKADQERVESALRAVRELNKAYLSEVDNAKRANDALVKNAQTGLRSYLTARERLVDELAKGVAEANDAIKTSQERVASLIERHEEREFGRSLLDLDDTTKAVRMMGRARNLASDAARALSSAMDKDQIAGALRFFERAFAVGESAASIAERVEDRNLEAKAAQTLRDITDQQIRAEQELQKLQADRAAKLEKERLAQQKIVDSIREQIKVVLDNSKIFTKEGQLLPAEELAKQAALRQTALRKIAESALSAKDLDLTRALGLADFVNRFSSELASDPVRLTFSVEEGIRKARADMQRAFDEFKLRVWVDTGVSLETLETALGKELKTPDAVARGLTELRTKAQELRAAMDAATASQHAAMKTAEATAQAAGESLDRITERLEGRRGTVIEGFGAFQDAEKALTQFRAALADPGLNVEKLRALADAVQPLADRTGLLNWGGVWNVNNLNDFSSALESLLKKSKALETLKTPLPNADELQRLENIIQRLKPGPAVQEGVGPSAQIRDNLWSGAQATAVISSNLSGSGNVAHKALGGAARGTDTIPAMLSPGEFVVSAKNARRFLPQLQAINAGVEPVYRETGGTTVNVGDINIHETKGPKTTAREVVAAIRREQRRGSAPKW